MANVLLTPDIIAREALMVLENNLVMAGLVHRDYSKEFVRVGDTITVRRPAKFIAKNFTGNVSVQEVTEGNVEVKMNRFRDVTVNITSKQMALDLKSFSRQVVTPAIQAIAQAVDSDIMAMGVLHAGKTIPATENPTDLKDIGTIGKALDLKGVPLSDRRLVLNPSHKYRYAFTENMSKAAYAGSSEALRNAELGRIYTMDTYMSQNAPDTLAETSGTAKGYQITASIGRMEVSITGMSPAGGTIKNGDGFILDGYLYRFKEDKSASSGVIDTIKIDQPIHASFTQQQAMPITAPHSLAFHKNGIALVTRQLELPQGASKAAVMSANGLAVRVVFGYDTNTKTDCISFDILYGIKELEKDMIVSLVG